MQGYPGALTLETQAPMFFGGRNRDVKLLADTR